MQQVYSSVSKVMVDSRNGSNLLYLPLDKLLQSSTVTPGTTVVPPETAQPVSPATATDSRSRDGGRSRDRESR
jgi:membrane protease subunit HflK